MAQSSGAYLDCGDEALEPGEDRQCIAQFDSDFNFSDYDYKWSVSSGEIVQESVESVAFVAPNATSSGEVIVEGSVTDGSGEVISFERSVEFESRETPELPDFEIKCEDEVQAGGSARCNVEWSSQPGSGFDYSWSVDGPGSVNGNMSGAVFQAPKSLEQYSTGLQSKSAVTFNVYSSQEKAVDSESIGLVENSEQPDNVSELRQRVEQQQSQIEKQKERIKNQTQRIESQKETIQGLRETISELRGQDNESQKFRPTNPGNSSESERPEKPGWVEPDMNDSEDQESSENEENSSEISQEQRSDENETERGSDGNESSDEVPGREGSEQGSGSFLDVLADFFR